MKKIIVGLALFVAIASAQALAEAEKIVVED
jgi:hypothetical protein